MHDDLEIHLRGLKPRSLPAGWRREILGACPVKPHRPGAFRLLSWLYPGPLPTATLALLWLLILGFFLNTPPAPPTLSGHVDAAAVAAAREERQAILVLLDEPERPGHSGAAFALPLHPGGG